MRVSLNHTIVAASDRERSARFLTELLGLPAHKILGHFLVSETEFDVIFARIRERGLGYWADPFHGEPGRINHWDDGRGVYFDDPDGHVLEILTRPYGSGGTGASHPNPLLSA